MGKYQVTFPIQSTDKGITDVMIMIKDHVLLFSTGLT